MSDSISLFSLKTLSSLRVSTLHGLKSLNLSRLSLPGILVERFSSYCRDTGAPLFPDEVQGITIKRGNTHLILYRDELNAERRNFTIAHELGHILLGHCEVSYFNEREADRFAVSLLIPSAVILLIEKKTGLRLSAEDMLRYFPVSLSVCREKRRDMDSFCFPEPCREEFEIAEALLRGMSFSGPGQNSELFCYLKEDV